MDISTKLSEGPAWGPTWTYPLWIMCYVARPRESPTLRPCPCSSNTVPRRIRPCPLPYMPLTPRNRPTRWLTCPIKRPLTPAEALPLPLRYTFRTWPHPNLTWAWFNPLVPGISHLSPFWPTRASIMTHNNPCGVQARRLPIHHPPKTLGLSPRRPRRIPRCRSSFMRRVSKLYIPNLAGHPCTLISIALLLVRTRFGVDWLSDV